MRGDILDVVIVGQGLAGTALAWHLVEAGLRVALIDDDAPYSASKVSAGLFTPIMGRNFTVNDADAVAYAHAFYRQVEQKIGAGFLSDIPAVRLFTGEAERALWARRSGPLAKYLMDPSWEPLLPAGIGHAGDGGFVMRSAQLDAAAYLAASRAALPVITARVDVRSDVIATDNCLRVRDLTTRRLVFCEGFAGAGNTYFPGLPFRSAKGEILLVRLQHELPPMSIHRRLWMAPTAQPNVYRVGATFSWESLDFAPTAAGRAEIEAELRVILACDYDVVGHVAAVRPIISGGACLHASRDDPRICFMNGLGTKGATRAPALAAKLARHIIDGTALPSGVSAPLPPRQKRGRHAARLP